MNPHLKLILELQDLDNQIAELSAEIKRLPLHIAEIEKALDSHKRRLETDKAALAANQKERRKLEGDIQEQERKESKFKDQLMAAKNNEEYRAMQRQIEYCRAEIRKAEDRILDLMAASEPLEKAVAEAEAALAAEMKDVEAETAAARARTAEDERELSVLRSKRKELVAAINPRLYADYSRLQTRYRGVAVADASEGNCTACHMDLRPQFFQDLKRCDTVMYCESCGRIVYYRPTSRAVAPEDLDSAPHPLPIRKI